MVNIFIYTKIIKIILFYCILQKGDRNEKQEYSSLDDLPYNYANELLYIDPDRLYNLYGNAS